MRLSIVTCLYEMQREAPRTMVSMQVPYQKQVAPTDYEVIIIDNGADHAEALLSCAALSPKPIVLQQRKRHVSPVKLINQAVREVARGENLIIAIDGARIFSHHLISTTLAVLERYPQSFVYTLSCHLGDEVQMVSRLKGYNQAVEDSLIAASGWPDKPDALFGCSTLAGSSRAGMFACIAESNAMGMSRSVFMNMGGFDERFVTPGGGLANLELFARLVQRPEGLNVCLASETTFHQIHGGAATSEVVPQQVFHDEYLSLFANSYEVPQYDFVIFGGSRAGATPLVEKSISALRKDA